MKKSELLELVHMIQINPEYMESVKKVVDDFVTQEVAANKLYRIDVEVISTRKGFKFHMRKQLLDMTGYDC